MLHIAYLEDEAPTAKTLQTYIDRYAQEKGLSIQADHYPCAEDFLYQNPKRYDLLFMDIRMTGMTGMEAAEQIRKLDPAVAIIFITSLAQYAVKSYEVEALDFILKPVSYYQFSMKLDRAIRIISRNEDVNFQVAVDRGTMILPSRQIMYVEVSNHDLLYHTEASTYRARGSLAKLESQLQGRPFLRISSSHLINLQYLSGISGSAIILSNGESLWISRAKKSSVMAAIAEYLGGSI